MAAEEEEGRALSPFENGLRLMLKLHHLIEAGKGDSEEADATRDSMDAPWGWGGSLKPDEQLTAGEKTLLEEVLSALKGRKRHASYNRMKAAKAEEKKE